MDKQIINNVKLGKDVKIFNFVNLYGCSIDDFTKIGSFVEIQKNVTIGKRCKISSHTFICEGVHIEDNVFIGHNVTFINDKYPHSVNDTGELQTEEDSVSENSPILSAFFCAINSWRSDSFRFAVACTMSPL